MQKSVVLSWIVAFLLSSPFAVGQEAEASSTEPDAGKSSPVGKEEGREIAQKLLNDLDDILSKTTSAHQRVERVSQIIKAINRRVGQGSADGTVVIKATEELVAILKRSLDQLYQDAHAIRDGVKNDVLPEYAATEEKMKARLQTLDKTNPKQEGEYKEIEEIYLKAVGNRSNITTSLDRLDSNIGRLSQARTELANRLGVLSLWKEVNLKGADLIKKLNEFNQKVEEIYHLLNPNPS